MGRLFDAVSGLLTLRRSVNYEGQAAIELEGIADPWTTDFYEFRMAGDQIFAEPVVRRCVEDLLDDVPISQISARFHLSVAHLIVQLTEQLREERRLNRVVLSGGVFQNMWLLKRVTQLLSESGFEVFNHCRVPANDGGISLGQAAVANARLLAGRVS